MSDAPPPPPGFPEPGSSSNPPPGPSQQGFPPTGPPPAYQQPGPPPFSPTGPPPGYAAYGSSGTFGPPKNSGKAIASLVCGIVGLLCFGIILGPIALGLGLSAKKDIAASNGSVTGGGMATAGIVLGVLAVVSFVGLLLARGF
jgi:hypothetical protein